MDAVQSSYAQADAAMDETQARGAATEEKLKRIAGLLGGPNTNKGEQHG